MTLDDLDPDTRARVREARETLILEGAQMVAAVCGEHGGSVQDFDRGLARVIEMVDQQVDLAVRRVLGRLH